MGKVYISAECALFSGVLSAVPRVSVQHALDISLVRIQGSRERYMRWRSCTSLAAYVK